MGAPERTHQFRADEPLAESGYKAESLAVVAVYAAIHVFSFW
jgi:hypothetical protein